MRDLQERVTRTIFTERHLRESVLRDLTSLLATTALESVQNLDAHPQTRRSVINFGVRGLTHNIGVVAYIAHHVAVMQSGRIVEQGTVDEVLHRPQHDYTRQLLAAVPIIGHAA